MSNGEYNLYPDKYRYTYRFLDGKLAHFYATNRQTADQHFELLYKTPPLLGKVVDMVTRTNS